jgi:hypothetical protein
MARWASAVFVEAEAARGVAIEAVHEARPARGQFLGVLRLLHHGLQHHWGLEAVQQGVHDGAPGVARARMHHHARGLVHDPQLAIFVQGGQVDVLGLQVRGRDRDQGEFRLHQIPRTQLHAALGHGLAVHLDLARTDVHIPAGPGDLGKAVGQEAVQAGGAVFGAQADHLELLT